MDRAFWVFAYGSLMWRPEFAFEEARKATLFGWHRAMCILSTRYRGTMDLPGLVLGLDRGGCCRGVAYRIHPDKEGAVRAALDEREMLNNVYIPREASLRIEDGRSVTGYFFTARRASPFYAGRLAPRLQAELIRRGHGVKGSSRDYLANTVQSLDGLGLNDPGLSRLLRLVDAGPFTP